MANMFAFVSGWVAMESLRVLLNKLVVAQFGNTTYNKEFDKPFAIGETALVKYPQRFLVRDGLTYQEQGINRRTTSVTMDQVFGVDFGWDSVEKLLNMERSREEIKREYIDPIMDQLAQEIDSRFTLYAYQNTPNITGVLGTTPTVMSTFSTARSILMESACPPGDRGMIVTPSMSQNAVAANLAAFNPTDEISKEFKEGYVGNYAGSKWYESMSLYSHTAGTWAGAVTVTTAPATGATSFTITATAGDTFLKGDVFSVNAVVNANPSTRRSTGRTKTFTVTQALTAAGGGADVLNFWPPMYGPGDQYQNVDALPIAAAALTLFPGTSSPNGKSGVNGLNIQKDAFALVSGPLEKPSAVEWSWVQRDPKTGVAIRFVRAWDQQNSRMTNRFDVILGFGTLYSENAAVRVLSLT